MTLWQTHKELLAAAAIFLVLSSTCAAEKLDEVVKYAVCSNPTILMQSAAKYAQANQVKEATSGYLPKIDFIASYGRDHNLNYFTRLETNPSGSLTLTKSEAILSIKQMLFDGFAVRSEVEANSARDKSSGYHVLARMQRVILEATASYIDTIMLRSIYMHAKDHVGYNQQLVDDMVNNHIHVSEGDLDFAKARLSLAQTELLNLQRDIRDAQADYLKVVGKKPGMMYRPDSPDKALPTSEDAAVSVALKNNPLVFIANSDIQAARAEKRGAKSHYMPKLDLELAGSSNKNVDGYNQNTNSLSAMLYLTYNVFHGGKDIARERKSAWQLEEKKESLNETMRLLEQNMHHIWSAFVNYKGQLQHLKQRVEAMQGTRDSYYAEFTKGERELIDVLDAEEELFHAKSIYVKAQYQELFTRFMILEGIGKIKDYFNVPTPASITFKTTNWMDGF